MNTPKTTAVDWLLNEQMTLTVKYLNEEFDSTRFDALRKETYNKAREMQREQTTAFTEWLHRNRWFTFENGKWNYTFEMGTTISKESYNKNYRKTTAELYDIYCNETYDKSEYIGI